MEISQPKEKAKQLFDKFFPNSNPGDDSKYKTTKMNQKINAIDNCKILVNEILEVLDSGSLYMEQANEGITNNEFWIEVLSELEKLLGVQVPF